MRISKTKKFNFSKVKPGKVIWSNDERTFELAKYINESNHQPIPKTFNWGKKIKKDNWGWMGNKRADLCTCAAAGHMIMSWTSNTGRLKRPLLNDIKDAYCAVTNYNEETDENDEGVEPLKVLKHWRKNGIAGNKILSFALLKNKDIDQLLKTVYLFGGCYVGLSLPKSADKQFKTTKKWTIEGGGELKNAERNVWINHIVLVTGYKNEELRVITWGKESTMTFDFWKAYGEVSYAIFSETFIRHEKTPTGVDVDILLNDLAKLKKKAGN